MDETITISKERYEQLIATEFAMKILVEARYSGKRLDVLDAVLDTMREEEKKC
jgi:hypothetical protein